MGCHHITSSLRFPHPATPLPIRIQAPARTLDDIFAIVPRHLMAAPIDLKATVQRRVLGTTDHVLWTRIELRRLGLDGRFLSRLPFLSSFPLFLSHTLSCLDDTLTLAATIIVSQETKSFWTTGYDIYIPLL
jgi:hypothetical protein